MLALIAQNLVFSQCFQSDTKSVIINCCENETQTVFISLTTSH